ncbi:hypothetical protein IZ6_16430 [Terrihabitans soli]|uniref:Lectin-like protein BA14k n=1 Tax=Terrihabitans soli TaxID=708113 RepID=A0A6S6QWK4_9HYPH|nr:BA14K family protein [Terrihabitans soli]BCJ90908.1 hypothetical protein IZ6_16430 [Terrihabitans soli]
MRFGLLTVALVAAGGPAMAQAVMPNHLDCRFEPATQQLTCPEIPMPSGRSSAEPAPAALPAPAGDTATGSAERNAHCAAKYKSFDPQTGMYKSFTGKLRPCV